MAQEAQVRVRLDTRQAKGDLRALSKQAGKTAGNIGKGLRRSVGRGLGAIGLGGGIGVGLAAVKGSTSSGFGDAVGESFSAIGAQLNDFFLGDMDDQARATRKAREETIQAFGFQAGASGSIPPGARQFFENRRAEFEQEEIGRSKFEQDKQFKGPDIDDIIARIMSGFGTLISEAVTSLADELAFWR